MIERHALWSSIAANRGVNADTPEKRKALERWNEVITMDRLKLTREQYRSSEKDWLEDAIAILNLRDHYSQASNVRQ